MPDLTLLGLMLCAALLGLPKSSSPLRALPDLVIPSLTMLNTMLRAVLPSLPKLIHPSRDSSGLVIPSLTLLGSAYCLVLSSFLMSGAVLAGFTRHCHTKPFETLHIASRCLVQSFLVKFHPEGFRLT